MNKQKENEFVFKKWKNTNIIILNCNIWKVKYILYSVIKSLEKYILIKEILLSKPIMYSGHY